MITMFSQGHKACNLTILRWALMVYNQQETRSDLWKLWSSSRAYQ